MIYLNNRFSITERECSEFIRLIKLDSSGNYDGVFVDLNHANRPLGRGRYSHGIRHGYFETYYPDGKVKSRGLYKNNFPFDQWEFFYATGLPERTLKFSEKDTLLFRFIDQKGNIVVKDGYGKFRGVVAGGSDGYNVVAKGKVINGRPDGRWVANYLNMTFCIETFTGGKFVGGKFPNAKPGAEKAYTNKSFLNTFFYDDYFKESENFRIEKCSDSTQNKSARILVDYGKLSASLEDRMNLVQGARNVLLPNPSFNQGLYICLQLETNKKGELISIKQKTFGGFEFVGAISSVLRSQTNFASYDKIYFHMLLFSGVRKGTVDFKYCFTKDPELNPSLLRK
jgi:hypothetical protein